MVEMICSCYHRKTTNITVKAGKLKYLMYCLLVVIVVVALALIRKK
jgi:hypothetical protein